MDILSNALWGVLFLVISMVLVLTMYKAWAYPYDKTTHKSTAPRALVFTHRLLGYCYIGIYIFLMIQMVPRLWTYQVELPARTVAHLTIALSIGGILLTKITIVRFFKHMEAKLVPLLGTLLFVCTFVLVLLAMPVVLREAFLRDLATQGDMFSQDRIQRIQEQLPKTGLEDKELLAELASSDGLLAGRKVLTKKCVQCHDLRTILARPRTPDGWRQTVSRMANRSTVLHPISEREEWEVTAYLLAISPTLQKSLMDKRETDAKARKSGAAASTAMKKIEQKSTDDSFDLAAAEQTFQQTCSQCHAFQLVDVRPPTDMATASALMMRMVQNGLQADEKTLETVTRYLIAKYVGEDTAEAPNPDTPNPDANNPDANETLAANNTSNTQTDAQVNAQTEVDAEIVVRPLPDQLRFESMDLTATSGSQVRILMQNVETSGETHNFVLLNDPSVEDEVINAAYAAAGQGFAPDHPAVVAAIPAVPGGEESSVTFTAPEPGEYAFFCMMPGHSVSMRGTLTVTP